MYGFNFFNFRESLFSLYEQVTYIPTEEDFNKPLSKDLLYIFFEGSSIIVKKSKLNEQNIRYKIQHLVNNSHNKCYTTIMEHSHTYSNLQKNNNLSDPDVLLNKSEKKLYCLLLMAFRRTLIYRNLDGEYIVPCFNYNHEAKTLTDYNIRKG